MARLTPEQLVARRCGIGASEAAAVMGIPARYTPLQLYMEKRGLTEPEPETEEMEFGHILEPVIAEYYAKRNKVIAPELFLGEMVWHPHCPYLFATLDYRVKRWGQKPYVLEIKKRFFPGEWWGEDGSDEVPPDIAIQCQVQMMCVGDDRADVAVIFGGAKYRQYRLAASAVIQRRIEDRVPAWWAHHIIDGVPPEPMAQDHMGDLYPQDNGLEMVADDEGWNRLAQELNQARTVETSSSETRDLAENAFKAKMGDLRVVIGSGWKATWKTGKKARTFKFTYGAAA